MDWFARFLAVVLLFFAPIWIGLGLILDDWRMGFAFAFVVSILRAGQMQQDGWRV